MFFLLRALGRCETLEECMEECHVEQALVIFLVFSSHHIRSYFIIVIIFYYCTQDTASLLNPRLSGPRMRRVGVGARSPH